jgi:glyoxylase-like metal-dependent hydrolase (beta-lactamase superfamily II)
MPSLLSVVPLVLGPVQTNSYLVADSASGVAAVIDPAWDGGRIADEAMRNGWRVTDVWLTHAHFDHFGGAGAVCDRFDPPPKVALHALDQALWRVHGGAGWFGIPDFDPGPEPAVDLAAGMTLRLGDLRFEVRHAPGHSPGHVLFYCAEARQVFCGDVIFDGGVGRTDLPGGDWDTLLTSIREQILTLPDDVSLHPGHGPSTTVGRERRTNVFLRP